MAQFEAPHFKPVRDKIYFPDSMPPFIGLISDEAGRLFVLTYEKGPSPGEHVCDIFNTDGIFFGRTSLPLHYDEFGIKAVMKNGRLYTIEETENGYKNLVVYKMRWQI